MLTRRQLRLAVVAVIQTVTGVETVDSPGDWRIPPSKLPAIRVRVPGERKVSNGRTAPQFTTVVTVHIEAHVEGATEQAAIDAIDTLGAKIETAFFCGLQTVVRQCQQFTEVVAGVNVSSDGRKHVAALELSIGCEIFEAYEPDELDPALFPALEQIRIHLDTASPFDANGTYADPPFPDSVAPAPRIAGPDGRDEAELRVDLT